MLSENNKIKDITLKCKTDKKYARILEHEYYMRGFVIWIPMGRTMINIIKKPRR